MRKDLFKFICVFFLSIGSCYAEWTAIRTPSGEAVQCNRWGWVTGNWQTVWHNSCTPLEVRTSDGENVYAVATTQDRCKDKEVALFQYHSGDTSLKFMGCFPVRKN